MWCLSSRIFRPGAHYPLRDNQQGSIELEILRVRTTPTRFPTSMLPDPGGQLTLALHSKRVTPPLLAVMRGLSRKGRFIYENQ